MHGPVVDKIYVQPLGFLGGCIASEAVQAGAARWLFGAGSLLAFSLVKVIFRQRSVRHLETIIPLSNLDDYVANLSTAEQEEISLLLGRLCASRPALHFGSKGQLTWDRPLIQGIVNVTPDSFSDGGQFDQADKAAAHARALRDAGADILDIGGESTRPGAAKISIDEELGRVIPVLEKLKDIDIPLSIDTRNAVVMQEALKVGANIINDVSALCHDAASMDIAVQAACPVILMHAQNNPDIMQDKPQYDDVLLDVYDYLEERVQACVAAGIDRERLIIDPGIGFGKTLAHNIELLANLSLFHGLSVPVLLGVSRKSFIGHISGETKADRRLPGSLAAAQAGYDQGVQILRVHDVGESRQALDIWTALNR